MTRVYAQLGSGLKGALLQSPSLTAPEGMMRAPGPGSWSPDGSKIAFFWAREESLQLWVMPAAGGWPLQLTAPPLAVDMHRCIVDRHFTVSPEWSPDGEYVAFTARSGGEKAAALWVVRSDGGEPRRLTRHPGSDWCPRWSPDGRRIAFVSQRPPAREGINDIWIVAAQGGTPLQLTHDRFDNVEPRWSPDGKYIVFSSQRSDLDWFCKDICFVAASSGSVVELTSGELVRDRFPRWSPSGDRVFFLSDRSGYDEVWSVSLDGQEASQITEATGQDKGDFALSPDGDWLAYESTRGANVDIMVMPVSGGDAAKLSSGDGVSVWPSWSPDGKMVLFSGSSPVHSRELWVASASQREPRQLTFTMMGNLKGAALVEPESVRFDSTDGFTIEGLLYRPVQVKEGAKYPALLLIHGGPNGLHANEWDPFLHYLATKGYVTLAPNCRGSTGYGRAFMDANIKDFAGGDMEDWAHAVAYLKNLDYVHGDRIAIWGRSYGGFAALIGVAKLPDLFKVGICQFGPSNWLSFWDETTGARNLTWRYLGLPLENRALYEDRSPVNFVQDIRAPLLILQGAADDGVTPRQSEEMVSALDRAGKVHEYEVYEGEGHGFLKAEHVIDAAERIEGFLARHL